MEKLTGVILAAGMGTRLWPLTETVPKALVPVNGHPLIFYGLRFLRAMGVDGIVVVGGFCFEDLRRSVAELDPEARVVENTEYRKGSLYSVERGIRDIDGGFLLFDADHIFPKAVAPLIRAELKGGIVAVSDIGRTLTDDDMKIKLNEKGMLGSMNKKLTEWDRGYIGVAYCSADAVPEYRTALRAAAEAKGDAAMSEDVLRQLAEHGPGVAVARLTITDAHEVDYEHERDAAERGIALNADRYA